MGRISGPYAAAVGGVIFAGVVLLLAVLSLQEARREDLVFETATAAIQVLPFAFFGVIVAELVRRRRRQSKSGTQSWPNRRGESRLQRTR